ncbi:methyl-accepting chemotaxis protein [Thalassolituus sp. LLYu03]|uniref:methyl-accepting chemotaxis protein n=1 Tax=Thalassolituus sp. LLYu03 TaxID=3421656 RepID=UPI003D2C7CC3
MSMFKSFLNSGPSQHEKELFATLSALDKTMARIEFSMDGTILDANANFLSLMGYTLDEVRGKHHRIFVEKSYGDSGDYAEFWRALNQGRPTQAEFKRVNKAGADIWIQASYNPIADDRGVPFKVVKYATDITERIKKEQQNLFNANAANAMKICQANVMLADNDMNILYVNDSLKAMLEHREAEIKQTLSNFSVKNLIGTCVDVFHKKPEHQRHMIGELKSAYKTNLKLAGLTFSLTASPWLDLSGKRVGTIVEWVDITEQLAKEDAERLIADANRRVRQALDVVDTNAMIADNDGIIVYMNDSVQEMMKDVESDLKKVLPNFNANDLIGKNIDVFHKNPAHQRSMLAALKDTYRTQIVVGARTFSLIANPVFNDDNQRIGTVVEWKDMTAQLQREADEKRQSDANARVKQALDVVATNAMIADNDLDIVYLNNSVSAMLKNAEADLRKELPSFDAANLMGKNIDIFHKNPAHQRSMLAALKSTYRTQIVVGGRTFALTANPIFNDLKERIGTIVEWMDRTQEVSAEKEIDLIVEAAVAGDLSRRIEVRGKDGFFLKLAEGLNRLLTVADSVISDTVRVFDALAHGNLTRKIDEEYQGAFGKLKQDANSTVERLTEIITRIREAASTVSTGASEIAQGNADLSKRTESQASSLEETASSMEEMTSAVKQTGDNAVHANELASSAKVKAQSGGDVVSKAVVAMEEINHASKKIADIISVIDEIAFQTNLLALNAAVEAARAGEQGRGFAVVAGEVRNLAQRSAGAAREIKDLIRDSVDKVDAGTSLVNESGRTLSEIIQAVERVSTMIQEISTAAREQSAGIEQVNAAVAQMDEMTQQNAALVEEASAAGEAMAEQAQSMMQMMEFFTLDGNHRAMGGGYAAPAASTPPPAKPAAKAPSSGKGQTTGMKSSGFSVSSDDDDWAEF